METFTVGSEREMLELAARLVDRWSAGDLILLSGELGAGKTTFVRGALEALKWEGLVRSPSFNLMQVFPTDPPVMHADLYRVESSKGIGLEEYFEDHLCFIEWPDRLDPVPAVAARVEILFADAGRVVNLYRGS